MRFIWVLLLVFVVYWPTNAQIPTLTLELLTTKEGLPSNDVWCLNKDKQGFLWVGTGRNICRYDGYSFLRLDSLKLGYCSGIASDSSGKVYASIATGGLYRIDPGTLTVENVLRNNFDDSDPANDTHDRVFVDSHQQVWMSDYTAVKRYDPIRKKLRRYALTSVANVHHDATFFEDSKHRFWVISEIGLYSYDRQSDRLTCLLGSEAKVPANKKPVRLEKAFEDAKGNIWMGAYDSGLIRFSPADSSFLFVTKGLQNQNVICGQETVDENGRNVLLIGTEKGASLYYPDQDKLYNLPEFYDKGIHVKDIYDDKDNGILWIGTREGIFKYRYRNPGIHTVTIPANVVRLPVEITSPLQMPDGNFWLGLSHTGALAWHPSTNQFRLSTYPINAYTYRLRMIQNRPVAFTDKGLFAGNATGDKFTVLSDAERLFKSTEFRDGLQDRKGRFWIASLTEGLKVIDPKTNTEIKLWSAAVGQELSHKNYIRTLIEAADGRIWVATCPNGLYYFDEPGGRFVNIHNLPVNKEKKLSGMCINALQRGADGSVLVASWGGVNKISPTGQILISFDYQNDNLTDTYCSNICEDQSGNLWFSSNEGIHIANPKNRKIKYLSTIEGLYSNYPVGFLKTPDNQLILGHINTLNILNMTTLNQAKAVPNIAISSVEVKGKMIHQDLTREIIIQPDENSITLNFSTLDFEPTSRNLFSYQLEGLEPNWVDLGTQHTVSFSNLPAKSYTLRVRSSNSFGITSQKPLIIRFTIKPYFINTWFFRTLIGLTIAGLIVGMMRWRVNTLDERNRLDLQITEWRLKALQSQMNPHFLFNSLNSVQNYLLTNRGVEGAKYLSKFSKLVRRIMENSNHQYLSFEQIIDTLRMYVEIESFRFNHEFSYAFDIEENEVLLDAHLPPMLLQPYVENAIWHGLMPKEGEKKLKITARIQDRHIVCTIEDNGVGRTFAPRTEGHISRGQEMTKGIFESLRRKDSEAKIELIDLFDTDNNPAGTRVSMIIPIENV